MSKYVQYKNTNYILSIEYCMHFTLLALQLIQMLFSIVIYEFILLLSIMVIVPANSLSGSNYSSVRGSNGKCTQSIIQIKHSFNIRAFINSIFMPHELLILDSL